MSNQELYCVKVVLQDEKNTHTHTQDRETVNSCAAHAARVRLQDCVRKNRTVLVSILIGQFPPKRFKNAKILPFPQQASAPGVKMDHDSTYLTKKFASCLGRRAQGSHLLCFPNVYDAARSTFSRRRLPNL